MNDVQQKQTRPATESILASRRDSADADSAVSIAVTGQWTDLDRVVHALRRPGDFRTFTGSLMAGPG
jgi:hypothetical protein